MISGPTEESLASLAWPLHVSNVGPWALGEAKSMSKQCVKSMSKPPAKSMSKPPAGHRLLVTHHAQNREGIRTSSRPATGTEQKQRQSCCSSLLTLRRWRTCFHLRIRASCSCSRRRLQAAAVVRPWVTLPVMYLFGHRHFAQTCGNGRELLDVLSS